MSIGMMEAVALMPRTISEIGRMQEVVGVLDREMAQLSSQLYEFDERNISGVEDLSRLDTLKLNMERCRDTLEEHARWNQLVREAKTMMESGGHYSECADRSGVFLHSPSLPECCRLETLQNSLEILRLMPGHEERLETCQQLTSSLLAVIEARVLHDITLNRERTVTGHDLVHSLKEMLYVFQKLKRSVSLPQPSDSSPIPPPSCREDSFTQIYALNRPNKLRGLIEACFHSSSSPYASEVNTALLHSHKIPELYGQLNGFLFDESVTLLSLFPPETVPELLCLLAQSSLRLLHEAGRAKFLSTDFLTVEEFTKKTSNLLHGASETSLFQSYSLLYEPFLQQPSLFLDTESPQLQEGLVTALQTIQFDLRAAVGTDSLSLLLGDEEEDSPHVSRSGAGPSSGSVQLDLSAIDADDIALLFRQYAQLMVGAIHESFQLLQAVLVRGLKYLSGLRAKSLLRYLAPLCTQQMKALISKIEELRIASCLQTIGTGAGEERREEPLGSASSSSSSSMSAASVAKQLSTHDLSSSSARGKILLSCALEILSTAGTVCRLFSGLEALATEQLEKLFTALFVEPLTLKQAVALQATASSSSTSASAVGTTFVSALLRHEPEMESEMKAFLTASTRRSSTMITQSVFSLALPWVQRYKTIAEKYFFDLLTSAPEDSLRHLHQETIWSIAREEKEQRGQEGEEGEDLNRLPQQMLTQVGDHLLSLLQELESFASSNNLQDLLQLKGDAEALAVSSWRAMQSLLGLKEV
jgi:hypothetical protein